MKPLRLRMQAFGPYATQATVDFRALAVEGGLFLIHGQTGAGKTSILDGLCFALFGRSSGDERKPEGLRCDLAPLDLPTEVTLEFALGDDVYRVTRRPMQTLKKQRGEGVTEQKPRGDLFKLGRGALDAIDLDAEGDLLSAGVDKTDEKIVELIGMNEKQFRQVVVLPQGQFRKFLSSGSDDRERLLEALFRTERYRALAQQLSEQAGALAKEVEGKQTELNAVLSSLESADVDALKIRLEEAQTKITNLREAEGTLDHAFQTAKLRRDQARSAHAIGQELTRLTEGRASAQTRLKAAETKQAEAKARKKAVDDRLSEIEVIRQERDLVVNMYNQAKRLKDDRDELHRSTAARDLLLANLKKSEESIAALKLRREEVSARAIQSKETASQADRYRAEKTLLDTEREAISSELQALKDSLLALETQRQKRSPLATAFESAERAGKQIKLDYHLDQAARLARDLKPGEPCPVCGSPDHPAPSMNEGRKGPSLDEVETAEKKARAAESALRDLDTRVESLDAGRARDLAKLAKRLKVESSAPEAANATVAAATAMIDSLAGKIVECSARLEKAAKAQTDHSRAEAELEKITKDADQSEKTTAALRTNAADAGAALEKIKGRIEELEASVPPDKRDLETITARGKELRAQLDKYNNDVLDVNRITEEVAGEVAEAQTRLKSIEDQTISKTAERDELLKKLAATAADLKLEDFEDAFEKADGARSQGRGERLALENSLKPLASAIERTLKSHSEIAALEERYKILGRLAAVANGQAPNKSKVNYPRFVLGARLEEVLELASKRLFKMSRGQFNLRRALAADDKRKAAGLDLEVEDAYTGTTRPTASLSGGEGFMASLALALGLADVVQNQLGGVRLDAVFVDEGFGSLDPESLEQAMKTLIELKAGGRMVGVISHVPELREQIMRRLTVRKTPDGSQVDWENQ